ncbi:MAG: tetratricopeptide repeat protein [Candidatus Campbellbacteria bacterium]|nr:tetratricopeptide repeat protein [Candidatus Campbellbacteria bacterium]
MRLAHEEQYNNDADASVTDEFAEEAIRSLETAVERDPQDHESLFYLGYIHLFMRDNWERAAPYLERAYDLDPKDPEYLIGMGWVHSQNAEESLEDAQTAVTYYEESIEISPMPLAYNGLGHVLSNGINDQIRAIESLEQAIELDPSYVSPYHNLALAHARLGEKEKALEYYEGVYELTGENDTRRDELREELLAIDTINIQDDELAQ